jgi:hypothetical protein
MTGGIMPKFFAVRWQLGVGLGILVIAGTVVLLVGLRPAPGAAVVAPRADADYPAERDELQFLTAALGRIDTELQRRGDGAAASLRREREAVVQRLRDVAIRLPRDRLPADIAGLLSAVAAAAPLPATADPIARLIERTVLAVAPRELRTGLGSRTPVMDVSLAADPPPPLPLFIDRRPPHRAAASHDAAERPPSGDQTAAAPTKPKPVKDRTAAKEPFKQPATNQAAQERPSPPRAAADQPEGRTAAR